MLKNQIFKNTTSLKSIAFLSFACVPLLFSNAVKAQDQFKGLEHLFTVPKHYAATYAKVAPVIDGDINDKVWANVPWTDNFVDIEGDRKPLPFHNTKAKIMWDKDFIYIAAEVSETDIFAYVKNHDEPVLQDNNFEVFFDPENTAHQYFEMEINAINTTWDLFLPKPYRDRGAALNSWESNSRTAVKVQGTLNNSSDKDKSWTVEMAFPYKNLNVRTPPTGKELWRLNFSRVEWYTDVVNGKYERKQGANGRRLPEHNWVWSPQGPINMHYPERWGYLTFNTEEKGTSQQFEMPYSEKQRNYLWLVYYRQKEFQEKNGKYAATLQELGISPEFTLEGKSNKLEIESGAKQFIVSVMAEGQNVITLNHAGLVREVKK